MTLEELLDHPCAWFVDHACEEIAISSRIRLARNLAGYPFPPRASGAQKIEIRDEIFSVLHAAEPFHTGLLTPLEDITPFQRLLLFERSLISREHAEQDEGGAIAVSRDEQDVIMINEEDHLRLQVVRSGLSLQDAWQEMTRLDDTLDDKIDYAFAEPCGYLTCCPSNTGTGMRAGVMLHLPGLALLEEIRPVMRGLAKMGLAVRGLGGEGSEADGYLFQISNQVTLGRSEEEILDELNSLVAELIQHEIHARARLAQNRPNGLRDKIGRAVGILQNAWELPSKEALDLLSLVRLGVAMDLLLLDTPRVIEQLMIEVRPCHLQKLAEKELNHAERDRFRAEWVRSRLADLTKGPKL